MPHPTTAKRTSDKPLSKAAVHKALSLLESQPDKPSLRQVSVELGVSHVALYRHFKDADALFAEVARVGFHDLISRLLTASDRGDLIVIYLQFALDRHQLYTLMMDSTHKSFFDWGDAKPLLRKLEETANRIGIGDAQAVQKLWMQLHGGVTLFQNGLLPARDEREFVVWMKGHV